MNEKPYGNRDDSDAGFAGEFMKEPWTVDQIRQRALSLGKKFDPSPDITDRLSADLADNRAVVLFTQDEVESAIERGFVPKEFRGDLINLVSPEGSNGIAVIPAKSIGEKQRQGLIDWFLQNTRC